MATIDYAQLAKTVQTMVENSDGLNVEVRLIPEDGSPAIIVNIVQASELEYWVGLPDDEDTATESERGTRQAQ